MWRATSRARGDRHAARSIEGLMSLLKTGLSLPANAIRPPIWRSASASDISPVSEESIQSWSIGIPMGDRAGS